MSEQQFTPVNEFNLNGNNNQIQELNMNNQIINAETFSQLFERICLDLKPVIEGSGHFSDKEKDKLSTIIYKIKSEYSEPGRLDQLKKVVNQMKAMQLELKNEKRLATLLTFLVIVQYYQSSCQIELDQQIYKLISRMAEQNYGFILYNTNSAFKQPLEMVGPEVIRHLRACNYQSLPEDRVLICKAVFSCHEECIAGFQFKNVVAEFTDVKKQSDFISGLKKFPNISCGTCLSDIYQLNQAAEILERMLAYEQAG